MTGQERPYNERTSFPGFDVVCRVKPLPPWFNAESPRACFRVNPCPPGSMLGDTVRNPRSTLPSRPALNPGGRG